MKYDDSLERIKTIEITVTFSSSCLSSSLEPVTEYQKLMFAVPELGYGWLTIKEP
jgi:hypothetical protein